MSGADFLNPLQSVAELMELRVENAQLAQRLANRLAGTERERSAGERNGGTPAALPLPPAVTPPASSES